MITMMLIAPQNDLVYAAAERQALLNMDGLRVRLVSAPCNTQAIYAAVETVMLCDWLHIAGHGGELGVRLDGEEVWSASEIAAVVQSLKCKLVWINTCSSIHLAKTIMEHTEANGIYNLTDANDQRAWQLPVYFARELLRTSPLDAFLQAAAADSTAIYVRSRAG